MAKVKRKKRKIKIILPVNKIVDLNGLKLGKLHKSWYASSETGRKVKTDFIVSSRRTAISSVLVDEQGVPHIVAHFSLQTLERFYKKLHRDLPNLRKIDKNWRSPILGLRHLSPDVTIVVHKKAPK